LYASFPKYCPYNEIQLTYEFKFLVVYACVYIAHIHLLGGFIIIVNVSRLGSNKRKSTCIVPKNRLICCLNFRTCFYINTCIYNQEFEFIRQLDFVIWTIFWKWRVQVSLLIYVYFEMLQHESQALVARTPPLFFLTFCLQIYFQ
jgi:hypothetical protein